MADTGLTLRPVGPDPQQQIRSIQQELFNRNRQLNEAEQKVATLEDEVRALRQERVGILSGVERMRNTLSPLYQALQLLFGDMEELGYTPGAENSAGAKGAPQHSAVWDSWKQKLGGKTAEAIDVLALHGEMNAEQLRIHLRCARTHIYNVIGALNKAGIIHKNGGRVSLKQL